MKPKNKIYYSKEDLLASIDDHSKLVFTNGCFDILHMGHIDLLTKAKALGDVLIVGINSDVSIKRIKSTDRPIFDLEYRMKMLSALSAVDFIIPFEDDTPLDLISKLLPNVLVKGGDYIKEKVVGYKEVTNNGGRVEIIPFSYHISTSNIINKLASIKNEDF